MLTSKETFKTKISFDIYESKLIKEYEYLLKYFDLNSNRIDSTINDLKNSLSKEIEENPENEVKINEFYEKQLVYIISFYYHSSITLTHSFFENQLYQLCKLIQIKSKTKLDISLFNSRDYIKSGLDYLVLTTGLEEEILNKHKPRLGIFQRLRNKIIHNNSSYEDEGDRKKLSIDFGNNIDFFEEERKFYLKSDDLPIEYLTKSMNFFNETLKHLKSIDFIIPLEKTEDKEFQIPF